MTSTRLRAALLAALGAASLGGCAYSDGYGYGYGGVSVGYGSRGYCDDYYGCDGGYGGYGYGDPYGDPWYGWYNGFYYPGIGVYIFDQWGRRYQWNDDYRRYWEGRRGHYQGRNWNDRRWERWDGFRNRGQGATPDQGNWQDRRGRWQNRDNRSSGQPWNENRGEYRQRGTQAPEAVQQPQAAQPVQPAYPRGNWNGGGRRGGEGRVHTPRTRPQ